MIRKMIAADKDQVLELIKEFSDDKLTEFGSEFNREAAGSFFDVLIVNPMLVALVYVDNDVIVGMIAGVVGAKMFTNSRSLQEIGWFVNKEHRGCGVRLLKEFEKQAKELLCEDVLLGGFLDTDEMYSRMGYAPFQKTYIKRIENET